MTKNVKSPTNQTKTKAAKAAPKAAVPDLEKPLIKDLHYKAPNLRITPQNATIINALSIVFVLFFAPICAFSAFSDFNLGVPVLGLVLGQSIGSLPVAFPLSIFCFLASLLALKSINKIDDASAVKNVWRKVFHVFFYIAVFYALSFATILLALLFKFDSGITNLLDGGNLLFALLALAISFAANEIVRGKYATVRLLSFCAVAVSFAAIVFTFGALMGASSSQDSEVIPYSHSQNQRLVPQRQYRR